MLDSATHTTKLSTDVDASTYLNARCRLRAVLVAALHTNCTLFLPQGAQWAKAAEVFEQMKVNRCTPDVVTYTALVSAYERGGQWMKALEAFTQMQRQPNCNADAILYNTLLDVLWDTGVPWAQHQAAALFRVAVDEGHFRKLPMPNQPQRPYATETLLQPPGAAATAAAAAASSEAAGTDSASGSLTAAQASGPGGPGSRLELGMQGVSPGVAMLMLHCWLADLRCVLLVLMALFMLGCVV
jgi:pentatricopeptide repeat protein